MTKHITILLLLILSSCTVTKRLHRKGFNVEWHKNYVNNNSTNEQKKTQFGDNKINDEVVSSTDEADDIAEITFNNEVELNDVEPEIEVIIDDVFIDGEIESQDKPTVFNRYNHSQTEVKPFKPFSVDEEPSSSDEEPSSSDCILAVLAVVFLLLGIFLILGSLFVVFGFPTNSGLFSALVLSGNGFIAGVFGFLLYLLILLLVILFVLLIQFVLGFLFGLILGISFVLIGIGMMILYR